MSLDAVRGNSNLVAQESTNIEHTRLQIRYCELKCTVGAKEEVARENYPSPRSLETITQALWPPKPKLLLMAASIWRSRGELAV